MTQARVGGLVLAAGAGTRFGRPSKLLAELAGRPLLEHAVDAMCAVTELARIVVVLGCDADAVLAAVDLDRAEPLRCQQWRDGLSASLRCGAAALSDCERLIVILGDAPDVAPEVIRRFLDAPGGSRATYAGRPGHPVVLGPEQLARLAELAGDAGARELLGAGPRIECGDLATGRDIDTTADLEEARGATRAVL